MRIKCIANMGTFLPDDCLDPVGGYDREHKFALEVGKEYTVYAVTLFLGYIWYYICDENYVYYPVWNPSPLFEVVDGRISRYWQYNYFQSHPRTGVINKPIFAFSEWANDPINFYDKLTDKEHEEVAIFQRYKHLIDIEFPDPAIKKKATDIGNNWVMCPECDESWQASSENGMLKCPKCSVILHNPLYKDGTIIKEEQNRNSDR